MEVKTGKYEYEFYTNDIFLPSSNKKISIFFYPENDFFKIELSLPKFAHGQNISVFVYNDFIATIYKLEKLINTILVEPTVISDWEIMRLDLCYAWKFNSSHDLNHFLGLLKKRSENINGTVRFYPSGISVVRNRYSVKFYDKGREFIKNDFKEISSVSHELALDYRYFAQNVLRFEITLRKEEFIKRFGKISVLDLNKSKMFEELNREFSKFMDLLKKDDTSLSSYSKLLNTYTPKKARRLFQYWVTIQSQEYSKTLIMYMDRNTVWRNNRDLKLAQIGFNSNLDIISHISIPSILSPKYFAW